ncbi:MAG: hypothetical protein Kow0098_07900 [Ignavibacteriaceae bacterium]
MISFAKMNIQSTNIWFKVFLTLIISPFALITPQYVDEGDSPGIQLTEQILYNNSSYFIPESEYLNQSVIIQNGHLNSALINQIYEESLIGDPNLSVILQYGINNSSSLTQTGSGNTSISTQIGNDNFSDISLFGDDNFSWVLQFGNQNYVKQDLTGDGLSFIINQIGNQNYLLHYENRNQYERPIQIHQNGDGMKLIIIEGAAVR